MILCSIQNIALTFGENELFRDVSFHLEEGVHAGLAGMNGTGKSTLFRLLLTAAGAEHPGTIPHRGTGEALFPDAGRIEFSRPVRVGLLEQAPAPAAPLESEPEFRELLSSLGTPPERLDIPAGGLSGGERIKAAIARLLAERPDLLLLDEPTNNLDFTGITALTEAIGNFPGTLLVVSHDRWFLDQTVSCIYELENGRIEKYSGGYTDYRQEKSRLFGEQLHRWEEARKRQTEIDQSIRRVRGWADKAHRDSTKADSSGNVMGRKEFQRKKAEKLARQAKNQIRRLERMKSEAEPPPREEAAVRFELNSDARRGKRILEVSGLSKSFGGRVLFRDSSFTLLRGEHAALFGENGCGKTTFLKIMQGELAPDTGSVKVSPTSDPFVLSQDILVLPEEQTPLRYLRAINGSLTGEQRTLLANMGLSARHLEQRISSLSLGERMKVKLAELIFSGRDFLVLDEPTNYLDLHARETLEDALSTYGSTLLVVSHDVYFLKRICDKVLLFNDGRIQRLEMSFSEYLTTI